MWYFGGVQEAPADTQILWIRIYWASALIGAFLVIFYTKLISMG